MEQKQLKLVEYSESSSSNSSPEPDVKYSYPKIAVVNPVQIVRPQQEEEPEEPAYQPDETAEFDPDESLIREPISSSSDDQPEQPRGGSEIPEQDITEIPVISENPEPEIIILSSDSDTLSLRTDTTLGLYKLNDS